jgi:lysozyme family protein
MKPPFWEEYFKSLMDFEGRDYEHDPDDPGGETKFGIDKRSHPEIDIKNLTIEQAEEIYLEEFNSGFFAALPSPLSLVLFDFAVTSGEGTAAKALQRAIGVRRADGVVGPQTRTVLAAALAMGQLGHRLYPPPDGVLSESDSSPAFKVSQRVAAAGSSPPKLGGE